MLGITGSAKSVLTAPLSKTSQQLIGFSGLFPKPLRVNALIVDHKKN
jgi:hypothetical protein